MINFESLSEERSSFATLAKNLMTTVNVDSQRAKQERRALMEIASERGLLVCSGHGDVSRVMDNRLVGL